MKTPRPGAAAHLRDLGRLIQNLAPAVTGHAQPIVSAVGEMLEHAPDLYLAVRGAWPLLRAAAGRLSPKRRTSNHMGE